MEAQQSDQATGVEDKIEGLDSENESWGDYPIDDLLIRQESRTIHDVIRRIDQGNFVMGPDFQRDFIWPEDKQSKLIESVIMRIPLPVFYLAEDAEGRMVVVDGLQRLSTFQRFVKGDLKLNVARTAMNLMARGSQSLNRPSFRIGWKTATSSSTLSTPKRPNVPV